MSYNKNENSLTAENSAKQPALVHDTERQKVTVSKETFAYLKCLQRLDTLYEYVYEALALNYGWGTAEKIMNEEYFERNFPVRNLIEKYMCISICEKISSKGGFTEI